MESEVVIWQASLISLKCAKEAKAQALVNFDNKHISGLFGDVFKAALLYVGLGKTAIIVYLHSSHRAYVDLIS